MRVYLVAFLMLIQCLSLQADEVLLNQALNDHVEAVQKEKEVRDRTYLDYREALNQLQTQKVLSRRLRNSLDKLEKEKKAINHLISRLRKSGNQTVTIDGKQYNLTDLSSRKNEIQDSMRNSKTRMQNLASSISQNSFSIQEKKQAYEKQQKKLEKRVKKAQLSIQNPVYKPLLEKRGAQELKIISEASRPPTYDPVFVPVASGQEELTETQKRAQTYELSAIRLQEDQLDKARLDQENNRQTLVTLQKNLKEAQTNIKQIDEGISAKKNNLRASRSKDEKKKLTEELKELKDQKKSVSQSVERLGPQIDSYRAKQTALDNTVQKEEKRLDKITAQAEKNLGRSVASLPFETTSPEPSPAADAPKEEVITGTTLPEEEIIDLAPAPEPPLAAEAIEEPDIPLDQVASGNSDEELKKCLDAISDYFKNDVDQATLQKFLQLQGKLTLHKLAWAHLKKLDPQGNVQGKLEDSIGKYLDDYENQDDPKFKAVRENFERNPLSRTALAETMPYVGDILKAQITEGDIRERAFMLNSSDFKMLHILAEKEKINSATGKLDDRLFKNHNSDQSILNFTKIVNSSYRDGGALKSTQANMAHINKMMESLSNELFDVLSTIPTPTECRELSGLCDDEQSPFSETLNNIVLENSQVMNRIFEAATETLGDALHENLRYGKFWLHVKKMTPAQKEKYSKVYNDLKRDCQTGKAPGMLCKDLKNLMSGNIGQVTFDEEVMVGVDLAMRSMWNSARNTLAGDYLAEKLPEGVKSSVKDLYTKTRHLATRSVGFAEKVGKWADRQTGGAVVDAIKWFQGED